MTDGNEYEHAPIAPEEYEARRMRAAEECRARGLDGLIAWARGGSLDTFSDVHYLTGHYSPGVWVPPLPPSLNGIEQAVFVLTASGACSLVVSDYTPVGDAVDVRRSWDLREAMLDVVAEHGLGGSRVGIVGMEVLPHSFSRALSDRFPSLTLVDADEITARLRLRLSPAEQDCMRYAGHAGSAIYTAMLGAIREGQLEGDAIGAALAVAARTPGCSHWGFLASSGPDAGRLVTAALPAWNPTYVYRSGDLVHTDCFGFTFGYGYDLARTVVVGGSPTRRQVAAISGTREACAAMASRLEPGVTPAQLHAAGMSVLDDAGLKPLSIAFGHGIGAGFFRPLMIPAGPDSDLPLEPPLGIAFEVLAATEDGTTAYHEDNYLFTHDGSECLTAPC